MADPWPLIGRAEEVRRLAEILNGTARRGAVLVGGAGVGKTRLARECVRQAEGKGFVARWATATRPTSELPLGAIAHLLPTQTGGTHTPTENRADLLRQSAGALLDHAAGQRLLLVVDDAHLLDDTSAMLLSHLVLADSAFVLATVRSGEPVPDPVLNLWKDDHAERLEVRVLGADSLDELLVAVLGGRVDTATMAELATRCQGNVMFLRELVLGALADGSLIDDDGVWRLIGELSPSERLSELIRARLGALSAAERRVLEYVSYGEPLGSRELSAIADLTLVEELEHKGLLTSCADGRGIQIRAAHPLYSDVLRAGISAVRLASIAGTLANVVESTPIRDQEDTLRVAKWRLDSGTGGRRDLMLAAAHTARWRYDFALAERLAQAAARSGSDFNLKLLMAQLSALQGHTERAEQQLFALGPEAADNSQRAQLALTRIDNLCFQLGRGADALAVAVAAEAAIDEPRLRQEIAARRSGVLLMTRGPRAAAEVADELVEQAHGNALVLSALVDATSLARLGRIEAAMAVAERGSRAHLDLEMPSEWYPWFSGWVRCEALARAGLLDDAEQLAKMQYQTGLDLGSLEARAFSAHHIAAVAAERGHPRTSIAAARDAASLFRRLGRPTFVWNAQIALALAFGLAHRPVEAARALGNLEALDIPPPPWTQVDLLRARAWIAVARDDLTEARRLLGEAADKGDEIGDLVGAADALHTIARLGRPQQVLARLCEMTGGIEGPLADARRVHVIALADRDGENLDQVSVEFEAIGADLLAAEAAADALAVYRRTGRRLAATAAWMRATQLAQRCEGGVTPGLRAMTGQTNSLTASEWETGALAANGRSNREIAEELVLSVRTVENRLQRIYAKLHINSRAELARLYRS